MLIPHSRIWPIPLCSFISKYLCKHFLSIVSASITSSGNSFHISTTLRGKNYPANLLLTILLSILSKSSSFRLPYSGIRTLSAPHDLRNQLISWMGCIVLEGSVFNILDLRPWSTSTTALSNCELAVELVAFTTIITLQTYFISWLLHPEVRRNKGKSLFLKGSWERLELM